MMQKREKVAVCFENIFLQRLFGYLRNASERCHARSAINTIQAKRSVVIDGRAHILTSSQPRRGYTPIGTSHASGMMT